MRKGQPLHGRHAYDLEAPDIDKIASNAWVKAGEIFPETSGFVLAVQNQVISTSNYKKHILKDPTLLNKSAKNAENNQKPLNL